MIMRNQPPSPNPTSPPRGIQARPLPSVDRTSSRPGIGLKPQDVLWRLRMAEGGSPAQQCDMFEDVLENDGHLRGQYLSRMRSVAQRPVMLQAGADDSGSVAAAEILGARLRRINLSELLWAMMDAIFMSYSATEIDWQYDPKLDLVLPNWFMVQAPQRFRFDDHDRPRLRTESGEWPGELLRPAKWVFAHQPGRQVVRTGLMRTCVWWAVFKRLSVTDWITFANMFGIPLVMGKYEETASEESRRALEQAVVDIGTDGAAVLSEATRIVIESGAVRSGDLTSLHPAIVNMCNAEMSKVVTGATLNVETGGPGSFALGQVHQQRSNSLSFSDAEWVQELFYRFVTQPFVDFNPGLGAREAPRLVIQVQPDMDPKTQLECADIALNKLGMLLNADQLYTRSGFIRPTSAANTLKRIEPDVAKPAAPAS